MSPLADVNFLVALIYEKHVHHEAAMRWLASLPRGDTLALCRVAQMGVLRILTSSRIDLRQPFSSKVQAARLTGPSGLSVSESG